MLGIVKHSMLSLAAACLSQLARFSLKADFQA